MLKKKIWAFFQRIIELFTQKLVSKLSKIWVWDPGSGIRDPGSGIRKKPIPDPGTRIQGSKRHRIPDPGSGSATLGAPVWRGWRHCWRCRGLRGSPGSGCPSSSCCSAPASQTSRSRQPWCASPAAFCDTKKINQELFYCHFCPRF